MKKLLALLLAGLLVLSACGGEDKKPVEKKTETKKVEPKKEEVKEEKKEDVGDKTIELGKSISFKDFDITIKKLAKVKDSDGKPAIKYVYDFTNKKEDKTSPFMDFSLKGFQDGIEVDNMILVLEGVDLSKGQKEIKSNATLKDAEGVVAITDESKPLNLELSESFNLDNTVYKLTVDPKTIK